MQPLHVRLLRRVARPALRVLGGPAAALLVAALRLSGRRAGVALMYHSVEHRAGDPERELVPPHEAGIFEGQVRWLARHLRVVPAEDLLAAVERRRRGERFPAAITFDDDLACHAAVALPALRRAGAHGTFFLSGASLQSPFRFWWERLQAAVDADARRVPAVVGVDGPAGIHELGLHVEELPPADRDAVAERLTELIGPDPPEAGMRASQVRELVDAGMAIGFHTRRHDGLALLPDDLLERGLDAGRAALEEVAGAPLTTIGYPHGRADQRVADAARAAGFRAGFTIVERAIVPGTDPLLQGRISPSLRSVGHLAVQVALALLRPGGSAPATGARARRAS